MSAEAQLSGLFPPNPDQVYTTDIDVKVIGIHYNYLVYAHDVPHVTIMIIMGHSLTIA